MTHGYSPFATGMRRLAILFCIGSPLTAAALIWLDKPVTDAVIHSGLPGSPFFHFLDDFAQWPPTFVTLLAIAALAVGIAWARPANQLGARDKAAWATVTLGALVLEGALVYLGKVSLARMPPYPVGRYNPDPFIFFVPNSQHLALPSGHAATAFVVATMIAYRWPRLAWPALSLATLIALGQVFLRVHWLSDVIAGGIVCAAAAIAVWSVALVLPPPFRITGSSGDYPTAPSE